MSVDSLKDTIYERPACCVGCEYYMSDSPNVVHCPTNVALGTLGRVSAVVGGDLSLDDVSGAHELADQLPMLSDAAVKCGELMAAGTIDRPSLVTTDLSLTNFTVHASGHVAA